MSDRRESAAKRYEGQRYYEGVGFVEEMDPSLEYFDSNYLEYVKDRSGTGSVPPEYYEYYTTDKIIPVNDSSLDSPTPNESLNTDFKNDVADLGENENLNLIKEIFPKVQELLQNSADSANSKAFENWNTWLDEYKKFYGSRYQMQIDDMRKAGINPLLIGHSLAPAGSINIPAIDTFKADSFNPQYSMTASAQVSGLANLYSTLIKSDTDKQIAILQNELGLKQVDAQNVRTFVSAIGSVLSMVLGAANPLGSLFMASTNSIGF